MKRWGALFPGQGSQYSGMGKFLVDHFKVAKDLFEEASDTLSQNFKRLCFDGSESDLALTENTQPALLLVSVATFRVVESEAPVVFTAGSGHSVGEYSALVAAGSISFSDGLRITRERGRAMQAAVPVGTGGMVATLGLTEDQARTLSKWVEESSGLGPLEPANFNAPGQIVLSGTQRSIDWLNENFDPAVVGNPKRFRLIPLKVSAPFHCSLMKPAQEKMEEVLSSIPIQKPRFPIVQNVDARECDHDPSCADAIRKKLVAQVSAPVLWVDCVKRLQLLGVERTVEMGPGQVLAGLVKKIDSGATPTLNINSLEELKAFLKAKDEV